MCKCGGLELTKEQEAYVDLMREAMDAVPDGFGVAVIVETKNGFFILGNCCEPCAHATIHMAADHCEDPRRGTTGLEDIEDAVIVVQ
jgi:hypothetical protein